MKRLYSSTNEIKFESLDLELELFKKPVFVMLATIQNFPSRFHELKKFYQNGQLFHMFLRIVHSTDDVRHYSEQIQETHGQKSISEILYFRNSIETLRKKLIKSPTLLRFTKQKGGRITIGT